LTSTGPSRASALSEKVVGDELVHQLVNLTRPRAARLDLVPAAIRDGNGFLDAIGRHHEQRDLTPRNLAVFEAPRK
jgi:hypothetical protein